MQTTRELLDLIQLEQMSDKVFLGKNGYMGSPNIFGGQLVAQALNAAIRSVSPERICHSLHAYFILPGNLKLPVIYEVEHIKEGGSFTVCDIVAKQDNTSIFVMTASFYKQEEGYEHQVDMPEVPEPEMLTKWLDIPLLEDAEKLKKIKNFINAERPVEMRTCFQPDYSRSEINNHNPVWFRFREVPQQLEWIAVQQLIAYASDYNILGTALRTHGDRASYANTHVASLDHSIWFHHTSDIGDWLLFDLVSPVAASARGFATGRIFNRSGKLVASVAQEGLLRPV